jgi:hypothetical protein
MGGPWAKWEWFELSLSKGVNNLHTFAIEKKAQRKRGVFNPNTTSGHECSESQTFPNSSLPHLDKSFNLWPSLFSSVQWG